MESVLGELIGLAAVVLIFGSIPGVIIAWRYFNSKERMKMQETIRLAIDKGQPLPPEVIDAISREAAPRASPQRDLRRGIVWIAVALGMIGFAYALGYSDGGEAFWPVIGLAAFPGFIGLALVIMAILGHRAGVD